LVGVCILYHVPSQSTGHGDEVTIRSYKSECSKFTTETHLIYLFMFWSFEFVSDFVLRISNIPDKKQHHVSDIYLDLCMAGIKDLP